MATAQSLAEFRKAFPDEASCAAYLFERRWPNGFVCSCGGRRYSELKSRAYTFECRDCRRQTSIAAGTVMHRSHLPLTKWFSAAHLIATHPGAVSTRELQARLRIAYHTASVLKRKLQLTKIPRDDEPLQDRVEVARTEISFQAYSRTLQRVVPDKITVVIALEVPEDEPAQAMPKAAFRSNRLRLAAVLDSSLASIEAFVRTNVKREAILLSEDLETFLGLLDNGYDLQDFGKTLPQAHHVFSALKHWFSAQVALRSDQVEARLGGFVAEVNWRVSFDRVLQIALNQRPTSYWELVGHENPRKGVETVRRRPRRRKTTTGMRADGSGVL